MTVVPRRPLPPAPYRSGYSCRSCSSAKAWRRSRLGSGIALFVAVARRRRRCGCATMACAPARPGSGLGLATGVAGVLSASIGYLIAGVSIAAGAGALLLMQVLLSRKIAAGFLGTLTIAMLTALFAVGSAAARRAALVRAAAAAARPARGRAAARPSGAAHRSRGRARALRADRRRSSHPRRVVRRARIVELTHLQGVP